MFLKCSRTGVTLGYPAQEVKAMGAVTYFVVQPFRQDVTRKGRSRLVPGEARQVRSAADALRQAQRCAEGGGAAVAFSRSGDMSTGDFEDAVILGVFGPVPEEAVMAA
jgi:hypothetical protein